MRAGGTVLGELELNTLSQVVYYETDEEIIKRIQNLCSQKNLLFAKLRSECRADFSSLIA